MSQDPRKDNKEYDAVGLLHALIEQGVGSWRGSGRGNLLVADYQGSQFEITQVVQRNDRAKPSFGMEDQSNSIVLVLRPVAP